MVRREAAERVGWLDEDYFLFLEKQIGATGSRRQVEDLSLSATWKSLHLQGKSAEMENESSGGILPVRYHFFEKKPGLSFEDCSADRHFSASIG